MKKHILLIMTSIIFILVGCTNLGNTPKQKTEDFFNSYQSLDDNVVSQLNTIVDNNLDYNSAQKSLYRDIMEAQFRNLIYQIKDEETNANKSKVTVEITVKDFSKVIKDSEVYLEEHKNEFIDVTGSYKSKFIDYQLEKMRKSEDKVKYTLEINLTKNNDDWSVDLLSDDNIKKICGTYKY